MRYLQKFLPFCAVVLSGCAIRPLPENAEGYRTIEIVEKIRCEAKLAIKEEVLRLLNDPISTPEDQKLAAYLEEKPSHFRIKAINAYHLTSRQRYFFDRYVNTAIAYNFSLDITEDNLDSTEVDLLKAVTGGTVGLNLVASAERKRENRRGFLISEPFSHLIDDDNVCNVPKYDPARSVSNGRIENPIYPITGYIGLGEIIKTFIELNREEILGKDKDSQAPTLADTIIFTTTFIGSANPQVMLNPVGRNFDVKMATLKGQATRMDVNQVIIGLSLFPKSEPASQKSADRRPFSHPPATMFSLPLSPSIQTKGAAVFAKKSLSQAEDRAIEAISQQRIDTFYDKLSTVLAR